MDTNAAKHAGTLNFAAEAANGFEALAYGFHATKKKAVGAFTDLGKQTIAIMPTISLTR